MNEKLIELRAADDCLTVSDIYYHIILGTDSDTGCQKSEAMTAPREDTLYARSSIKS